MTIPTGGVPLPGMGGVPQKSSRTSGTESGTETPKAPIKPPRSPAVIAANQAAVEKAAADAQKTDKVATNALGQTESPGSSPTNTLQDTHVYTSSSSKQPENPQTVEEMQNKRKALMAERESKMSRQQLWDGSASGVKGTLTGAFKRGAKYIKEGQSGLQQKILQYNTEIEELDNNIANLEKGIKREKTIQLLDQLTDEKNDEKDYLADGFMRLSASKEQVDAKLKDLLDGNIQDLNKDNLKGVENPSILRGSIIKQLIGGVRPLAGISKDTLVEISNKPEQDRLAAIQVEIAKLPQEDQAFINKLFDKIGEVSQYEISSRMGPKQLGIVLGPNLFALPNANLSDTEKLKEEYDTSGIKNNLAELLIKAHIKTEL